MSHCDVGVSYAFVLTSWWQRREDNILPFLRTIGKVPPEGFVLLTFTEDETSIVPREVVTFASMNSRPKARMASISLVNPPLFFSNMIFIQSLSSSITVTWTSAYGH